MAKKPDKARPQGVDGKAGKRERTPRRRIDLSSIRDVRLELAAVYRMVDAGKIASQDGTRRAYILGRLGDMIALAEIEQRVADLEERRGIPTARPAPPEHRTLN